MCNQGKVFQMGNVAKAIRHKRYQVNPKHKLTLYIETNLGNKFSLEIVDCSRNGICAKMPSKDSANYPEFEPNSIIPAGKIIAGESEYTLGRMVFRTQRVIDGYMFVGLSTVDVAVPITSSLSKYLANPLENDDTPFDFELSPDKFTLANFADSGHTNVDIFAKCKQFSIYLKEWRRTKKYAYHSIRTESKGTRINLSRKRGNGRNDYVIMGSNDYLGLASHPEVIEAAEKAISKYGFGSTGSPVTTGISDLHEKLVNRIAKIFKKEKALLYNSGYVTNVGIINALAGAQDFIATDFLAHASIHDALQMCKATNRYFKHNSVSHLERLLKENRDKHSGGMVITEGVFSMDGDLPPLKEIYQTARNHNCRLMVDEAHSFGVVGPTGIGACEKFDLLDKVDVIMGTFSKICGGIGGFAVGSEELIDWLHHFSRPYLFSVSIPPSTAAAADKALEIFEKEPNRIAQLKTNIKQFVEGVRHLGFKISENHESSIVPVIIGDEKKLGIMYERLLEAGIFVVPIIYPAVSRNNCRFRFTIMSEHTTADIDYAIMVLDLAMKVADFKPAEVVAEAS